MSKTDRALRAALQARTKRPGRKGLWIDWDALERQVESVKRPLAVQEVEVAEEKEPAICP